jgi:hypothetical protein
MTRRKKKVTKITSAGQLVEIFGQPNYVSMMSPCLLRDLIYSPVEFLYVKRVDPSWSETKMNAEERKLLKDEGWEIECESPLEIRHNETGGFASGYAARLIVSLFVIGNR